jgi:Big-like domain-containing protein
MSRAVICSVLTACTPIMAEYPCASDAQCVNRGAMGKCEATMFCSFPDASCKDGGRRYGPYAGSLSGACVALGNIMAPCQTSADCVPALVCNNSQTPALYAQPNTCYDDTNPTVAVDMPQVQDVLSGMATVAGTASDNVGIYQLTVEIDSKPVVAMFIYSPQLPVQPFSVEFDTKQFANGDHTLSVAAYDLEGHGNSYSFHVFIQNP